MISCLCCLLCRKLVCEALIAKTFHPTFQLAAQALDTITDSNTADSSSNGSSGGAKQLVYLGSGNEGMVFTDSVRTYKVCLWGAALQRFPEQLQLLQQLGESVPAADSGGSTATGLDQPSWDCQQVPVGSQDDMPGPSFAVDSVMAVGHMWLLKYGPYLPGTARLRRRACVMFSTHLRRETFLRGCDLLRRRMSVEFFYNLVAAMLQVRSTAPRTHAPANTSVQDNALCTRDAQAIYIVEVLRCLHSAGVVLDKLRQDPGYLALYNAYMCSGEQLMSLARRCLQAPAVCNNVSPKNILLTRPQSSPGSMPAAAAATQAPATAACQTEGDVAAHAEANVGWDQGQLLLLDLGSDWVAPDPSAVCW